MAAAAATMVAPPGAPPSWVTLRFRVKYWTVWGQNLVLCGSDPRLGAWDVRKGVFMHCHVSFLCCAYRVKETTTSAATPPPLHKKWK